VSSRLALSPAALEDLHGAADWYDAQRLGLGDVFLRSVEACLARIERLPRAFRGRQCARE
jgi:plasmid stabilization system protein ParE